MQFPNYDRSNIKEIKQVEAKRDEEIGSLKDSTVEFKLGDEQRETERATKAGNWLQSKKGDRENNHAVLHFTGKYSSLTAIRQKRNRDENGIKANEGIYSHFEAY